MFNPRQTGGPLLVLPGPAWILFSAVFDYIWRNRASTFNLRAAFRIIKVNRDQLASLVSLTTRSNQRC